MSKKQYYLDPFNTAMPATDSARDVYHGKSNCTVIKDIGDLQYIESTATLLIDGHSARNADVLASAFENAKQTYRAVQLAIKLTGTSKSKRLPKTHILIRLLACYGGTKFAAELAYFLGLFGYKHIVVGGYLYSVWQGSGHRTLIQKTEDMPVENTTGSGNVVWYNNKRVKVSKPVLNSNPQAYNPGFPTSY